MSYDSIFRPNRRRFLKGAASLAGGAVLADSGRAFTTLAAFAQDPPAGCPTPPSGGTHFVPGNDTRPIILRKSISAFSPAELTQLQNAYAALRALPASDKRTWILQADMHALFCDSCNNSPFDIHGSWSFFPWHRGYLYYYERILGSLAGDMDHFRLPYWDWENIRTLPTPYQTPGSSSNSLWDNKRRPGLAGGGNLPSSDGTAARITTLYGLTDFASFGGDAFSGGSLESDPHGTIHVDVGQFGGAQLDMGNLGYAARDPLFFAHHCNIDKLWSGWNDLASGSGTHYKNPTDPAFLNLRWSFYDENQQVVSISAADMLNHSTNLRYTYKSLIIRVPLIWLLLECELICCLPGPDPGPWLKVSEQVRETVIQSARANSPVVLVLHGVSLPPGVSGNFDVFATRGERRIHVGSVGIIAHGLEQKEQHSKSHKPITLTLDITQAAPELFLRDKPATLHVFRRIDEQRPGFVAKGQKLEEVFQLKAEKAEIRVAKR